MKALNKHQAKAVSDALAALNNVGGVFNEVLFLHERITFVMYANGGGCGVNKNGRTVESYDSIQDFLVAYEIADAMLQDRAK